MSIAAPQEHRTGRGLLLMLTAVAFFTMIDTSAKWLLLAGLPPLQVVFARYAGHFVFALAAFLPGEGRDALISRRPGIQALRSSLLLFSTLFNFSALNYLPITITTTIAFAGPIAVTLLSIPILGERVGIRRMLAILMGFFGVLVVIRPWGAEFHPAMLLSLGTLTCASLYFVLTRKLAGTETNATSQVWSSGIATIALAPFVVGIWTWPQSVEGWAVMGAIGLFGGLGHSAATVAHRFADASILAPMIYLQIIFATVAGIVVFSTYPTVWTLLGAAIIVASGIYTWQRERKLSHRMTKSHHPRKSI